MDGNLEQLDRIHSLTGPSPALFQAYSGVYLQLGDTAQAVSCAEAAVQAPGALPEQYAWAIDLRSRTGGDYDGLFREAVREFPGSVALMTARLRAPLSAGLQPDRRDLLELCLLLDPVSVRVLETAAAWHLASGSPDSALVYAERALAASAEPGPGTFVLACTAASGAGDRDRALIHARWGLALYPGVQVLEAFLSEAGGSTDGQ
jgi:tetratricopeptide (TPR) repeat protein